jgi:hypothetical protein
LYWRLAESDVTVTSCGVEVGDNDVANVVLPSAALGFLTKMSEIRKPPSLGVIQVKVPKIAGSLPAEAVGFFRAKKSSACLPSEGK